MTTDDGAQDEARAHRVTHPDDLVRGRTYGLTTRAGQEVAGAEFVGMRSACGRLVLRFRVVGDTHEAGLTLAWAALARCVETWRDR
jgi:hypothetical protein